MEDIKRYQVMVDETVRKLGGYWRPLSGLARLLEELGELNEVFLEKKLDQVKLAEELADLFIISTSIGNQYCTDLNDEFTILQKPYKVKELYQLHPTYDDSYQGLMELAKCAGQIGRILNHYEGDKKKKPTEKKQRVAQEIAKLHLQLIMLANFYQIRLFDEVERILKRDSVRDHKRFAVTFDPVTATSLERFKKLNIRLEGSPNNVKKLWGALDWDSEKDLILNLLEILPSFIRFSKIAPLEGLQGFVLEARGLQYVKSENRNEVLRTILSVLHQYDPLKESIDYEMGLIEGDFHFHFNGAIFDWIPYIKGESLFIVFRWVDQIK